MTTKTTYTVNEVLELYELPLEELLKRAQKVSEENLDNSVEFCSIISARTGKCSQNCKYCAQSSHYRTDIATHPLVSVEEVKKCALESRANGANRFSLVTSGRLPSDKDFETLLEMVKVINDIDGLSACASLGILTEDQVIALKEAGLVRYHHNFNSCESYYPEVCTTHTWQDRLDTINLCKKHGLELCVGGIIGMGETRRQRAELAVEVAEVNPLSIPMNFLHPVPGTPFEKYGNDIDEEEILRTLAAYRIVMPKVNIRYAGGRASRFSKENQLKGLKAGVDGVLIGNYLTTTGITPDEDKKLVEKAGKFLK